MYISVCIPRWLSDKESACQYTKLKKIGVPSLGQEDPSEEETAPTLLFSPGESRGQRGQRATIHGTRRAGGNRATEHTRVLRTRSSICVMFTLHNNSSGRYYWPQLKVRKP